MSTLDSIEVVLAAAGTSLRAETITEQLLERGLWHTAGATPAATIASFLAVDIKKHGITSRFQRISPGMFALRAWGLPEYLGKKSGVPTQTAHQMASLLVLDDPQPLDVPEHQPDSPVALSVEEPAADLLPVTPPTSEGDVQPLSLSFTNAAEQVLKQSGNKQPMHYRAITDKALVLGLIKTAGSTPEATLHAQIGVEIRRDNQRGEVPRFVNHGKGLIGLTAWLPQGLVYEIEEHNKAVRKQLYARLMNMHPVSFELLMGTLLSAIGFEDVAVTAPSGDGGIDVRGTLVVGNVIKIQMAVQVKRWKKNVQKPEVQKLRGSLGSHERGLFITTSDFAKGAREEAMRPNADPIALMSGEQLVALLVENDIGVHRTSHDLIELGEEGEYV